MGYVHEHVLVRTQDKGKEKRRDVPRTGEVGDEFENKGKHTARLRKQFLLIKEIVLNK